MKSWLRVLFSLGLVAALAAAAVETGEINGAQFRLEVPEGWNGVLVMYCHGYSATPGRFESAKPNPVLGALVKEGYAVAQSGYAAGGWAIPEAVQDTEALRRHFIRQYGAPKETYVTGHSMGGFLTMLMVEQFPTAYDGGLALCGPLAPITWFGTRRVFDLRVVCDYYFPGVLPSPAKTPADYARGAARNQELEAVLEGKPEQAAIVRRWAGIRTNKELAGTLVFFTEILRELQQRTGGNPFDNRNTIYEGTPDDDALNDGVGRYAADGRAAEYLRAWYTPTGRPARPLLAIHNTYDVLVPPWVTNAYSTLTELSGSSPGFVQQWVKRPGHCAITPEETARGLAQLRAWKGGGKRPPSGSVPMPSSR
jgi:pimeloyl-ACP methyl ester carboxylesterase